MPKMDFGEDMQLRFIGCRSFLFWQTAKIVGTLEHLEHSQRINDLPQCNMEHFLEHWNIKDLAHVPHIINDLGDVPQIINNLAQNHCYSEVTTASLSIICSAVST